MSAKDTVKASDRMRGVENGRIPVMTGEIAVDGTGAIGMEGTHMEARIVNVVSGTNSATRTGTTAINATTNVVIVARTGISAKARNSAGTTANKRRSSTSMPSWKRMASSR